MEEIALMCVREQKSGASLPMLGPDRTEAHSFVASLSPHRCNHIVRSLSIKERL